ncbi:MAG: FtsB family cell division protein [Bacteroidales bacterium]
MSVRKPKKKTAYIIITLLALFFICYKDTYSLYNNYKERYEIKELEAQKQALISDIAKNKSEIKALKIEDRAVEKVAREKLYMKKDGEDVYVIKRHTEK